ELRVARGGDHAPVAVDERDQLCALASLEVARVVGERRRVLDLEIGAPLRRAGDRAGTLLERGAGGRDPPARGARGAGEPRAGGLGVARESGVLERERDGARERDEAREREEQPEPDRPPEPTALRAAARRAAHAPLLPRRPPTSGGRLPTLRESGAVP